MGLFDSMFSSSSSKGGVPSYLRKSYERYGLDPDNEGGSPTPNHGTKMYCTMCRKIYDGGYLCTKCNNILVEWH